MEKFYVWLMPEAREVLVEDRGSIPVFATNLSRYFQEIVNDLGGNRTFDNWEDALEYGKDIAERMHWYLDIDNEAGRWAESEINKENGIVEE
jgi:hypothetical protein